MLEYALFIGGLAFLIIGAEFLIRGAVLTARELGVSPFLIGLTLIAFGTSLPELVASIQAAVQGAPALAIGNIVGSNIANILLILGAATVISPMPMPRRIIMRDGAVVLLCSLLFFGVAVAISLDRMVGFGFLLLMLIYLAYAHRSDVALNEAAAILQAETELDGEKGTRETGTPPAATPIWRAALMAIGGLFALLFGAKVMVESAITIARLSGVSEAIIGMTIVAVGTALPELVTTTMAALRQHSEMAMGNILGSNIYNILLIGGVTGLVAPTDVPEEVLGISMYVMLMSIAALIAMALRFRYLSRPMGVVLLAGYAAYLYYL